MIANFADSSLWMYVTVDDLWQRIALRYARPGPAPACSDSELITMVLVGECRGWDLETDLVAAWQLHRDLFPVIPERSRFNRRRQLALVISPERSERICGGWCWRCWTWPRTARRPSTACRCR